LGLFHLRCPRLDDSSAVTRQVALADVAIIGVALIAHDAGHPDLIRSSAHVLAHRYEDLL